MGDLTTKHQAPKERDPNPMTGARPANQLAIEGAERLQTTAKARFWAVLAVFVILVGGTAAIQRSQRDEFRLPLLPWQMYAVMGWVLVLLLVDLVLRRATRPTPVESHGPDDRDRSADQGLVITCSGGGIKSASFCLGALQRLDERQIYKTAAQLIGVSGGGYAATAFAYAKHAGTTDTFGLRTDNLNRLRRRTNYLAGSPRTRFEFVMSILIGIFATLLGCLALLLVTILMTASVINATAGGLRPGWVDLVVPVALVAVAVFIFLRDRFMKEGTKWAKTRFGGRSVPPWLLLIAVIWLTLFTGLVRVGALDTSHIGDLVTRIPIDSEVGKGVIAFVTSGGLATLLASSAIKGFTHPKNGTWGAILTNIRRGVAPTLALLVLFLTVTYFGGRVMNLALTDKAGPLQNPVTLLTATAIATAFRFAGNANRWSMHIFYRDQLANAFLGPELREGGWTPPTFADLPDTTPELILCATANLRDHDRFPTGREGTPFIFSKKHTGFTDDKLPPGQRSRPAAESQIFESGVVSLASAMAVSGAAISPIAGRDSRLMAPYRLLLSLANVRLGVWMPNPYWAEAHQAADQKPTWRARTRKRLYKPGPHKVLTEAFGNPKIDDPCLYLTDGGHYDNLGLVEALRSRPGRIIVLDGSGDPEDEFPTMGRAIATARMDLGVTIEFDPTDLIRGTGQNPASAWVSAKAQWSDPDGVNGSCWIDYVKCVLPPNAPWDVQAYKLQHPSFPSSSDTLEQYDEFDFEAYRQLGYWLADSIPK